jgi:hypothetical protein
MSVYLAPSALVDLGLRYRAVRPGCHIPHLRRSTYQPLWYQMNQPTRYRNIFVAPWPIAKKATRWRRPSTRSLRSRF